MQEALRLRLPDDRPVDSLRIFVRAGTGGAAGGRDAVSRRGLR